MDKNFSEDKIYTEQEIFKLNCHFEDLQDEIFDLENDSDMISLLSKNAEKLKMTEEIKLLQNDYNLIVWLAKEKEFYYENGYGEQWIKEIQGLYAMIVNHCSYVKIKYFEDVLVNLDIIDKVIRGLIDRYNIKNEEVKTNTSTQKKTIFADVLQVNRVTGLNLNAMEMVCSEWIEAKKIAIQEIKDRNKSSENDKS